MESLQSNYDMKRRHCQAMFYNMSRRHLGAQTLSASQQGQLDRQAFLRQLAAQAAETSSCTPPELPFAEAEQLVKDITPNLVSHYQWLAQTDTTVVARVMRDVMLFRQKWAASHDDKLPTARIYRQFRLNLEQDQPDEYDYQAVVVFEALVNGNIMTGQLPF